MQQNFKIFLPQHKVEKLVDGKRTIKKEPLFPQYLFAKLNTKNTNWTSIKSTRGINKIVEFGAGPAKVETDVIRELRKLDSMPPEPYMKIGENIKVVSGPLQGLSAIYEAADGLSRSIILLQFMQQNQKIKIDNKFLIKE